jgi:hypothetical protein
MDEREQQRKVRHRLAKQIGTRRRVRPEHALE